MKSNFTRTVFLVLFALVSVLVLFACSDDGSDLVDGDQSTVDGDSIDGDSDLAEVEAEADVVLGPCAAGYELNDLGMCQPVKPECAEGFRLNEDLWMCVPLTEEDYAYLACNYSELASTIETGKVIKDGAKHIWFYEGRDLDGELKTIVNLRNSTRDRGFTKTGTYSFSKEEADMKSCGLCITLKTGCNEDDNGQVTCEKTYMPQGFGNYTISSMGYEYGEFLTGKFENVIFQQVTIAEDGLTTIVENGDIFCVEKYEFNSDLIGGRAYMELDPPENLSCEYPEAPYYWLGPFAGEDTPTPRTVPPMGWPGAYINNESVGFNLAEYRCAHPEVKTLFVILSGGWCPACHTMMRDLVCKENGWVDNTKQYDAEFLFVIGDNYTPGEPATNEFANEYVNKYNCDEGIRISDVDNTAGRRVIYYGDMHGGAIPWACAIRMSDMKLMAAQDQDSNSYLPYMDIARENYQAATAE